MWLLISFRLIRAHRSWWSAPMNGGNNRTVQGSTTLRRSRYLKYWSKIILTSESTTTVYITRKIIIIKSLKVFAKNVPRVVVVVCLDSNPRAPSAGNYYKGLPLLLYDAKVYKIMFLNVYLIFFSLRSFKPVS